ncbi:MAG: LEA type 2 family protein [Deltaproteobacteria bacterium]|nr:LEA type 2 family protein [Deltaproteobacteria bacterium]MCB9488297.1 LEA type 2 family protein [Deltaproteobacteria bacterium]
MAALAVVLALFVGACATKAPDVTIEDIRLRSANVSAIKTEVKLKVDNPNKRDLRVERVDYRLFIKDKQITEDSIDKEMLVKANDTASFDIPVTISTFALAGVDPNMLNKRQVPVRIVGTVYLKTAVGTFPIPIEEEQTVKW